MNKLHGRVLELFLKDKKESKITNIVYGKKALDKYVDAAFKYGDETDKKKYLKRWNSSKLSNSVYFVYQGRRGEGHRFISNASKKGGHSYLGHLESKNKESFKKRIPVSMRRKRSRRSVRRNVQRGGFCPPCMIAPLMGKAAGLVGIGGAGYLASRSSSSSSSSSSYSNINGKKSLRRKVVYEMNKNGKKIRKTFIQNGLNLRLAGKKIKEKSLKKSSQRFNKAIVNCKNKGFIKC